MRARPHAVSSHGIVSHGFVARVIVALAILSLAIAARALGEGDVVLPVGYEGSYGRYLLQAERPLTTLVPLEGVVDVRRDGRELWVSTPTSHPIRFTPAGRHRFVAPSTGASLSFDVAAGRVRAAYLSDDAEHVLAPIRSWQASLLRLGHRLAAGWRTPAEGSDRPD